MKSIWDGTISFGLVNIPVSIFPATKNHELSFHFLHDEDYGRIHNERVCEKCGKKVAYSDIIRGYEFEKDQFVPFSAEDFEKVNLESAKNIDILDFVKGNEIDPMFYFNPYYLVPSKQGEKAYVLLRDILQQTKKVGVAKFILRTRENLAAVKAKGEALMLDLMHFSSELKHPEELQLPKNTQTNKKELEMAKKLVESMSGAFKPEKYKDTYRENLLQVIDKKLKGKEIKGLPKQRQATNVIDLMSKLKASLQEKSKKPKRRSA